MKLSLIRLKVEFVANKATKGPFPRSDQVANRIHLKGLELGISLYPGTGTMDGTLGDHVLIAPAYTSTEEEIEYIVSKTKETVEQVFEELTAAQSTAAQGRPHL
jgi:adenosylmethionine-8-amino-7-oxononanoate aminotransferase